MTGPTLVPVTLTVINGTSTSQASIQLDALQTVESIIRTLLAQFLPGGGSASGWALVANGAPLRHGLPLGAQVPALAPGVSLQLVLVPRDIAESQEDDGFDETATRVNPAEAFTPKPRSQPGGLGAPGGPPRPAAAAAPAPAAARPAADTWMAGPPPARARAAANMETRSGTASVAAHSMLRAAALPDSQRSAAVRYYTRMNPQRVFPLLVTVSRSQLESFERGRVRQSATSPFTIEPTMPIDIEPIVPGCQVHPPVLSLAPDAAESRVTFYVVPQVVGELTGARVEFRQGARVAAVVPLRSAVRKRTWAVAAGVLAFVMPFVSTVLRSQGLDFEAQSKEGFNLYLKLANVLFGLLSPLTLGLLLAAATGAAWWLTRPKAGDAFWGET